MKQDRKTYLKAVLNILTALVIFILCIVLLPRLIVFFMPFIIGWAISLIAAPLVRFLEEKLKIRRKAVSVLVIVAVLAAVVMLVYIIGARLIEEIISFINALPDLWNNVEAEFERVGANLSGVYERLPEDVQNTITNIAEQFGSYFSGLISSVGTPTFTAVGNFARQLPDIVMAVVMLLLSAYFFVAEKTYMSDVAKKYIPTPVYYRLGLIRRSFRNAIGGYFKAQFKIEGWIYLILLAGLMILGVDYAFLIALGIAFIDLLPVFGAGFVMLPWAVIEILSGDYPSAIGLLIIWGVVYIVRQVIQPKIMGDSIGIDPIPTLFLLYIGYKLAGMLGLILALPLGMILINLYEEGAFDTTKESVEILVAGFNSFRRLNDNDKEIVTEYEEAVHDTYEKALNEDTLNEEKAAEGEKKS